MRGYNLDLKFISDCDLIIRALKNNYEFSYLNIDVSNFLLHDQNASSSKEAKNEFKKYRLRYNKNNFLARIEYIYTVFILYKNDFNYFFYKLNNLYKYLIIQTKNFMSLKYSKNKNIY